MSWPIRIFIFLVLAYLALAAIVFTAQRRLIYFPPDIYLPPASVGLADMEEVSLPLAETARAPDGPQVTGWWHPPSSDTGSIVMVFHGNGSAVYSNADIFADLIRAGHGVWSVGYPGYPGSDGTASQTTIVAAAAIQRDAVDDRNPEGRPVVYYGTSLGSGVAAQLAQDRPPARIFMDAPFNSVTDMARKQMGRFLPVGLLLRERWDSDRALSDLDVPLYWTHGTEDRVIPLSEGQKLYDGYDGPKAKLVIPNGQHTNLWGQGGREFTLDNL